MEIEEPEKAERSRYLHRNDVRFAPGKNFHIGFNEKRARGYGARLIIIGGFVVLPEKAGTDGDAPPQDDLDRRRHRFDDLVIDHEAGVGAVEIILLVRVFQLSEFYRQVQVRGKLYSYVERPGVP